jgi:hypothetical protein
LPCILYHPSDAVKGYTGSDRSVIFCMFMALDNNLLCHCEPGQVRAWQSPSASIPSRLLRHYTPRNDKRSGIKVPKEDSPLRTGCLGCIIALVTKDLFLPPVRSRLRRASSLPLIRCNIERIIRWNPLHDEAGGRYNIEECLA